MPTPPPTPGSTWKHREGNAYTVIGCPDIGMVKIFGAGWLNGPWVQYSDAQDIYLRTLADFAENFTEISNGHK
jgi:hypothetical protein